MFANVLIVGFGNIGKRHFEGLIRSKQNLRVFVIDDDDFAFSNFRFFRPHDSFSGWDNIDFGADIEFDLCIISTPAKDRSFLLQKVMLQFRVKNFILEKPVEQTESRINSIYRLVNSFSGRVSVNCPRLYYPVWDYIFKVSDKCSKIDLTFKKSSWGLLCNFMHYLHIFLALNRYSPVVSMSCELVQITSSRRKGIEDALGNLRCSLENGSRMLLSSHCEEGHKFLVLADEKKININSDETMVLLDQQSVCFDKNPYQSEISWRYLETDNKLPSFKDLYSGHCLALRAIEAEIKSKFPNRIVNFT